MTRWSTEDLGGSETILEDTIIVETCHYTCVKIIKYTPPRVNPNIHYGHWEIKSLIIIWDDDMSM